MNSKYFLAQTSFEKNKYAVVRNIISQREANFFYNYTMIEANAISHKIDFFPDIYNTEWDGKFGDPQVNGAFSKYGDSVMDTLSIGLHSEIEKYLGKKLFFNYSYWRLYQLGNTLKTHTDRKSCDISATLCLGWNADNLKTSYNWPIFVIDKNGKRNDIYLNPGDILFYKGCELSHGRDDCKCLNHSQVFLHFNDANSTLDNALDNRPIPGIPSYVLKY